MCFNKNNEENDDVTKDDGRLDIVSLDIFGSDNSTTDLVRIPHYVNKTKGVSLLGICEVIFYLGPGLFPVKKF